MSTVTVNATATTSTACGCCGTYEAATLECRSRGGTAVLCGYPEYVSPSTPPKKYRKITFSLSTIAETYSGLSCNTLTGGFSIVLSGAAEYAQGNCVLISQGTETTTINNGAPSVVSLSGPTVSQASGCLSGVEVTQTSVARVTNPTCCATGASESQIHTTSDRREDLSVEDTNQDAVDRLLAGAGGTWGAWLSPGATGCTGTPPPCCLARWEERTSDFDFVYVESEYRVTASGLLPSTGYSARVEIYRSVFGANTFSLFQTLIVSGTTDGSGNFSEDGAVPNEEGFESYAAAAYIVIPP